MAIRVLVVEDHEAWRRHISSALRSTLQYEVVGEATDGLEAVQAAARLKPDLIVLDVGLPTFNGIEVARRVLELTPEVKILFVSEHRLRDIVDAALGTGAHGYILKSDAGAELLPGVEAITAGKPFISACLKRGLQPGRRHEVEVCSDEAALLDGFVRVAEGALNTGNTAIVLASRSHQFTLHQRLRASGVDLDLAIGEGRFVSLDVADLLSAVIVNGWPDEVRFWALARPLIVQATKASKGNPPRVAAYGEGAPTLWNDGHAAAALRLEQLWDTLTRIYNIDIYCGYLLRPPIGDDEKRLFEQICAEHSAVHSGKAS
jgi:DNA-binding NarL/FixJ family response regulator